ncbi:MAG: hypothetical protein CM1200mP18_10900 [Gammaproteobacteria bacterium]|nr:MAG: hypothetical protein CM1200mP18_10900 [Gammaproteobacteria bacterium]
MLGNIEFVAGNLFVLELFDAERWCRLRTRRDCPASGCVLAGKFTAKPRLAPVMSTLDKDHLRWGSLGLNQVMTGMSAGADG